MPNLIPVTRAMAKNILVCYFLLLGGFRDWLEGRVFLSFFFLHIHDANDQACFNKNYTKILSKEIRKSYHVSVRDEICFNMGFPTLIF